MANINVGIKNEVRLARAWAQAPNEVAQAIAETIRAAAVFMTGKVKEHIAAGTDMWKAPLDTGAMRRGIHPVFESMKARIVPSSATPYAEFVHEGTRSMRARPFFEITASREADEVEKFASERIDKALKVLSF